MKIWKKIIYNKSNKIAQFNSLSRKTIYPEVLGRKSSDWAQFCKVNEYYLNKNTFLKNYFKNRFKIWDNYLRKNISKNQKILSIGSGRAINELILIDERYNIVSSDLDIPETYEASKKIFDDHIYLKFDVLKHDIQQKFNIIFSLHTFYLFSESQINLAFKKVNKLLHKDGIFIVDMNTEHNLFSTFYHDFFLKIESTLIYLISKFFKKNIGIIYDDNFGYKYKRKEIIEIAKKNNFELLTVDSIGYNEINRSYLLKKIIKKNNFIKKIICILFKSISSHNIYKFKKL
jgi:hypothetical protein